MDDSFPDEFDLIIWGHEHLSVPDLITVPSKSYKILMPGSTVATSLKEDEAE